MRTTTKFTTERIPRCASCVRIVQAVRGCSSCSFWMQSDGKLRIRTSSNSTRQKPTPKMEDFDLDDDLSDCDEVSPRR